MGTYACSPSAGMRRHLCSRGTRLAARSAGAVRARSSRYDGPVYDKCPTTRSAWRAELQRVHQCPSADLLLHRPEPCESPDKGAGVRCGRRHMPMRRATTGKVGFVALEMRLQIVTQLLPLL
jgi:hypothetical protein